MPSSASSPPGVKVSAENLLVDHQRHLGLLEDRGRASSTSRRRRSTCPRSRTTSAASSPARRTARASSCLIDVEPDVPPALLGDAVRIQQVLLNLGSNAVKFTSEGEVIIRVTVARRERRAGARCASRSSTRASGSPQADQQRLFRPFAQADSSTTRRFGGTGLGLAISRQLVELMGGELGLVSAPGQGSTFWFELSLARAERPASTLERSTTRRASIGRRALDRRRQRHESPDPAPAAARLGRRGGRGGRRLRGARRWPRPPPRTASASTSASSTSTCRAWTASSSRATLKADPATAAMTLFLLSSSGERLGRGRVAPAGLRRPV